MKVAMPKCYLCGTADCYRCPVCDRFVCNDCTVSRTQNFCDHKKYEPPRLPSWTK